MARARAKPKARKPTKRRNPKPKTKVTKPKAKRKPASAPRKRTTRKTKGPQSLKVRSAPKQRTGRQVVVPLKELQSQNSQLQKFVKTQSFKAVFDVGISLLTLTLTTPLIRRYIQRIVDYNLDRRMSGVLPSFLQEPPPQKLLQVAAPLIPPRLKYFLTGFLLTFAVVFVVRFVVKWLNVDFSTRFSTHRERYSLPATNRRLDKTIYTEGLIRFTPRDAPNEKQTLPLPYGIVLEFANDVRQNGIYYVTLNHYERNDDGSPGALVSQKWTRVTINRDTLTADLVTDLAIDNGMFPAQIPQGQTYDITITKKPPSNTRVPQNSLDSASRNSSDPTGETT